MTDDGCQRKNSAVRVVYREKPETLFYIHHTQQIWNIIQYMPSTASTQSISECKAVCESNLSQVDMAVAIGGHRYWKVYSTPGLTFRVMIGYSEALCWAGYMLIGYSEAVICWSATARHCVGQGKWWSATARQCVGQGTYMLIDKSFCRITHLGILSRQSFWLKTFCS